MSDVSISSTGVKSLLTELDKKEASGPDGVQSSIFQETSSTNLDIK